MRECWNEEPANRPSFDDICTRLEAMLTELEEKEYASLLFHSSLYSFSLRHCPAFLSVLPSAEKLWVVKSLCHYP